MATLITSPSVPSGRSSRKESSRENNSAVPPAPRVAGPKGRMLSLVPHLELETSTHRARPRRPKPDGDHAQL